MNEAMPLTRKGIANHAAPAEGDISGTADIVAGIVGGVFGGSICRKGFAQAGGIVYPMGMNIPDRSQAKFLLV